MTGFIPAEKYIKKEISPCGAGIPISFDEEIAKYESTRPKNLDSVNQWLEINIPNPDSFLIMEKPILQQSNSVIKAINDKEFIQILFIKDFKALITELDDEVKLYEDAQKFANQRMTELFMQKKEQLQSFDSGLELINFVNKKCKTHDMSISTALLYKFGIYGSLYKDDCGQRALIFNAHGDTSIVKIKSQKLKA